MMSRIQQMGKSLRRARRFVLHDVWHIGKPGEAMPRGFVIKQVRVLVLLVRGALKDALLLRSAALTFATLLGIVPALAVMALVVQTFEIEERIEQPMSEFLARGILRGVPSSELDVGDEMPDEEDVEESGEEPLAPPGAAAPAADDVKERAVPLDQLQDPVAMIIHYAQENSNPKALGFVGIIFIAFTVFGLMSNIEMSFNQIWGITRIRSIYRMLTDYIAVLLVMPLLVVGVFVGTAELQEYVQVHSTALARSLQYIINNVAVWLAFTALYFFVPNTKVRFRYALLGGAVAGILWNLTAWAWVNFLSGVERQFILYDTFALIPVALMWIYISWLILLICAELVFAYQNEKTYALERLAYGASEVYREVVGLRALFDICWRFERGLPGLDPTRAAELWKTPTRLLNDTLGALEDAGLVRRTATDPVTYQPAKSPHRITVSEVVKTLREAGEDPASLWDDPSFRPFVEHISEHFGPLGDMTIAEALEDPLMAPSLPDEEEEREVIEKSTPKPTLTIKE